MSVRADVKRRMSFSRNRVGGANFPLDGSSMCAADVARQSGPLVSRPHTF